MCAGIDYLSRHYLLVVRSNNRPSSGVCGLYYSYSSRSQLCCYCYGWYGCCRIVAVRRVVVAPENKYHRQARFDRGCCCCCCCSHWLLRHTPMLASYLWTTAMITGTRTRTLQSVVVVLVAASLRYFDDGIPSKSMAGSLKQRGETVPLLLRRWKFL